MRSCDTCPGGSECAADNMVSALTEVYALYAAGTTNKFDILFSLPEQTEDLFEKYNDQISRICWTKAALDVMAGLLASAPYSESDADTNRQQVRHILKSAVDAYTHFPWYISGLIGQAGDLYEEVCYQQQDDAFASALSSRQFVKICKDIVYENK